MGKADCGRLDICHLLSPLWRAGRAPLSQPRAEDRDTQSIHAKLDELLHAHSMASNAMTRIDEEEPEDIKQHRQHARKDD